MIEFFFIRHAESEVNTKKEFIGGRSPHTTVTNYGTKQAELLGERLGKLQPIHKLFSSPLRRAYDTACIVAKYLQIPTNHITVVDELQELDQGTWQGKLRTEVYTPEIVKHLENNCWEFQPPNGESQKIVCDRMMHFLETEIFNNIKSIKNQYKIYRVAIISHGVAIKCLLRHLMNFDAKIVSRLAMDNTSITRLQWHEDKWHILNINDTAHLYGTGYESKG